MKEWEWRVKKGLSTIRLRVFRSKAGFEESIGVSGEGGGRYRERNAPRKRIPCLLLRGDAEWYQPFMEWDRSGVGIKNDEILEIRAVFNAFQTCPRPPSLREIISFFLRTFFL